MMIYLDYLASTPSAPEVLAEVHKYSDAAYANPHSFQHAPGAASALCVEQGRQTVAKLIDADPREIVFTSGATESNNLAIKGAARFLRNKGDLRRRIITVATEHKCVLESVRDLEHEGFEPHFLPVDRNGQVLLEQLRDALRVPTLLVSIMAANNETGFIQDIPQLGAIARESGAVFHCDAAQAAGKIPFTVEHVDLASLSGHKIYGPKGIGALYIRRRPRIRLTPLFSGGGQERGLRSGTLPTPLIAGFARACALTLQEVSQAEQSRIGALRDQLQAGLQRLWPEGYAHGDSGARLPGALNFCLRGGPLATELMTRTVGLAYSTGSACMSAEVAPSYVLRAMGVSDDDAARSLRLSVGRFTSSSDITQALTIFADALRTI